MNPPSGASAATSTVFGAGARVCFDELLGWLEGEQATALSHSELEDEIEDRGRELLRRMLQDHLSLRTRTEQRLPTVLDAEQVAHAAVETGHVGRWPACSAPSRWNGWPIATADTRTCIPLTQC